MFAIHMLKVSKYVQAVLKPYELTLKTDINWFPGRKCDRGPVDKVESSSC